MTDVDLAKLLQLDEVLVERLVEETDVPRVMIAGQPRFITSDVMQWLSRQDRLLAVAERVDHVAAPEEANDEVHDTLPSNASTLILPATEDEVPFITRGALSALSSGAADPDFNLARQRARDGLASLGDALHPTLVRLSNDRLQTAPAETDRTSPWRLDDTMESIQHIAMAWGEGSGPPGFTDRPALILSITADSVEFSIEVPAGTHGAPVAQQVKRARSGGAMVKLPNGDAGWTVTYFYEVTRGAPTKEALRTQLARDAKTLVPLWLGAVEGDRNA